MSKFRVSDLETKGLSKHEMEIYCHVMRLNISYNEAVENRKKRYPIDPPRSAISVENSIYFRMKRVAAGLKRKADD